LSYFTSEPQLERSSHSNIHSFKDRDFNFFVDWSTGGASSYIVEGVHWGSNACSASELHGPIQWGKKRRMYWQPSFSRKSCYCKWTFKRKIYVLHMKGV
jgi:hypothetical protein